MLKHYVNTGVTRAGLKQRLRYGKVRDYPQCPGASLSCGLNAGTSRIALNAQRVLEMLCHLR